MKKVFGILFVILGVVCLPSVVVPDTAEMVGRLIGTALFTFLPAYFLLRNSDKKEENDSKDKEVKSKNPTNSGNEESH